MRNSIAPVMEISKQQARRFMLYHQGLLLHHQWQGKAGILEFFQRAGCIQFDPVNVIARNPDLVLQARVRDYQPRWLEELLYQDRALVDGFDKLASIYPVADWPFFTHRRQAVEKYHQSVADLETDFMENLIQSIRSRGPLSSLDIEKTERVVGYWGNEMHIERFALERLLALGLVIIHHRAGSRRYYDLAERVLPTSVYETHEPFENLESYQDWHFLRRIGGMGIANPATTECWLGITGMTAPLRWDSLRRLSDQGIILPVEIDGLPRRTFFIRRADWERYSAAPELEPGGAPCIFLGPLDNLLWDRNTIRMVFDFDYKWEVYTPVAIRKYGPYTLPILRGDAFAGRVDLKLDRKNKALMLNRIWWEPATTLDEGFQAAFASGLDAFRRFSGADHITLAQDAGNGSIDFLRSTLAKQL